MQSFAAAFRSVRRNGPGGCISELGPDPIATSGRPRHRAACRRTAFRYTTVTGLTYETGDYHAGPGPSRRKLKDDAPERVRLTHPGQLLGRGIATFVEPGGIVSKAPGPDGTISVMTALANEVMDALAPYGIRHPDMPLPPEKIRTAIQRSPDPATPAE